MTIFTEPMLSYEGLISESNGTISRDKVTFAGGNGIIPPMSVLGKITASSKYVVSNPAASDGSQTAIAVSLVQVDTTNGDVQGAILARDAEVVASMLLFYPTIATSAIPAPVLTGVTTSPTGGTIAAGTEDYKVTFITPYGETAPSNEGSVTSTGSTSSNTVTWNAAPNNVTAIRVYKGATAGGENAYFVVPTNATSFVDTGAAGTSGSPPANTNTTQIAQLAAVGIMAR